MNPSNPLLTLKGLADFSRIQPQHLTEAIEHCLDQCRATIEQAVEQPNPNWENTCVPMDEADDQLSRAWACASHLNAVVQQPELREAYEACLPLVTEFSTWVNQHPGLYQLYQQLLEQPGLNSAQQARLTQALRDFRLSGIDLPAAEQKTFADIQSRLSELTNRFSNQVLDATEGWKKHITDEHQLKGLPDSAKAAAAQLAKAEGLEGWLISLHFPSFYPVMTYADDRALRKEIHLASITRASDRGPQANQWDNAPLMEEILALRQQKARLLGFDTYADLSLARKMADSPEAVLSFLLDLARRAKPQAAAEMAELQAFALSQGLDTLQPWDLAYYSEKLRQAQFDLNQEALRPWFPVDRVLQGLFRITQTLFQVEVVAIPDTPVWHDDARYYELRRDGQPIAGFYLDLYARNGKRGGAWMANYASRRQDAEGNIHLPIAFLTCNFTAPVNGQPSLLTHQEVTTLFHEFGHGLHHMLTQIDVAEVAGINGVAWDAVELPSQFMENYCWDRQALNWMTGHVDTGEPLPDEWYQKLLAARHFQSAMQLVRQLEFSLFDFRLHQLTTPPNAAQIQALLDQVRQEVSVVPVSPDNRFQNSFSHIFAGGYAAGYYSYKWAEVLSADAFAAFEEEGIFNPDTGARFEHSILAQGGAREAMDNFVAFRGRQPTIDALLRHSGLSA